jgi:hypothetical protein
MPIALGGPGRTAGALGIAVLAGVLASLLGASLLLALLFVLCLVPVFVRLAGRMADWLAADTIVGIGTLVACAVRQLIVGSSAFSPILGYRVPLGSQWLEAADSLMIGGLIAFYCVYYAARRLHFGERRQASDGRSEPWAVVLAAFCVLASGFAIVTIARQQGGVVTFLFNISQARVTASQGNGILLTIVAMAPISVAFAYERGLRGRALWVLTIVSGALLLALGSRSSVIMLVVLMFVVTYRRNGPRAALRMAFALALPSIAFVGLVPIVREVTYWHDQGLNWAAAWTAAQRDSGGLLTSASNTGFDSLDGLVLFMQQIPSHFGFTYGYETFILPVEYLIPRFVWPSKPAVLDNLIAHTVLGWEQSGTYASIFGLWWMALGVVGVVCGMALFGAWSAVWDNWGSTKGTTTLYALVLYFAARLTVSGGSLDVLGFEENLLAFAAVWILWLLLGALWRSGMSLGRASDRRWG